MSAQFFQIFLLTGFYSHHFISPESKIAVQYPVLYIFCIFNANPSNVFHMLPKPVIVFAFANPEYEGKSLYALKEEINSISEILKQDTAQDAFEIEIIYHASAAPVITLFQRPDLQGRIVAFHYGGHANSAELMLEKGAIDAQSLAEFLGVQTLLQLVVLNGCATQGQVAGLREAGIKRIVATTREIEDQQATDFARIFYTAIAQQHSIEHAFQQAKSAVALQLSEREAAGSLDFNALRTSVSNWELFTPETDEQHLTGGFFFTHLLRKGAQGYYDSLTGTGGRFQHLRISDILLSDIQKQVQARWEASPSHCLLLGEGGIGKTVSLLHLWKRFLQSEGPIPIFVSLHEFNHASEGDQTHFISRYIAQNYLGEKQLTPETHNQLWQWLAQEIKQPFPKIILLLDGFNEITVPQIQLLRDLNQSWRSTHQAKGLQILLTSRFETRYTWAQDFFLLTALPLEAKQASAYLEQHGKSWPSDSNIQPLLLNPLMLTLYAETAEITKEHALDQDLIFRTMPQYTGEILWNFIESQVAKFLLGFESDLAQGIRYRWMLKHLLPWIGFEMERNGQYSLSRRELKAMIQDYASRLPQNLDNCFEVFPDCELFWDVFESLGEVIFDFAQLRDQLCNTLRMLKQEGQSYSFLHQNFRDFFAAVHIGNELRLSLHARQPPLCLAPQALSQSVRTLIAEIEGEYYQRPQVDSGTNSWSFQQVGATVLSESLEACRNLPSVPQPDRLVWNLISILHTGRGELTGLNLRGLDMRNVVFNEMRLGRHINQPEIAAQLEGARIHPLSMFKQSHAEKVRVALFTPSGDAVLMGYKDGTLLKQDIVSGQLIWKQQASTSPICQIQCVADQVVSIHQNGVMTHCALATGTTTSTCQLDIAEKLSDRLRFIPDDSNWSIDTTVNGVLYGESGPERNQTTILCADGTLRIFSNESGQVLHILNPGADYLGNFTPIPNSSNCLFGLLGGLYLWEPQMDQYRRISAADHSGNIDHIALSSDGKTALTGCTEGSIALWELETGALIHRFQHSVDRIAALTFSPDGKRAASGNRAGWICEWDLENGQSIRSFQGHSDCMRFLQYAPDGLSLLSGCFGNQVQLWELRNGSLIRNFSGYTHIVRSMDTSESTQQLAYVSENREIALWDLETLRCQHVIHHPYVSDWGIRFVNQGKQLLNSGYYADLAFWQTETGDFSHFVRMQGNQIHDIDCPQEEDSALFTLDEHAALLDIQSGKVGAAITFPEEIRFARISPNAAQVAVAAGNRVYVWNLDQQRYQSLGEAFTHPVYALAFDATSRYLVAGDVKGQLIVFDCDQVEIVAQYATGIGASALLFSSDGTSLFMGEWYSGKLYQLSCKTGEVLQQTEASPSGRTLRVLRRYQDFFVSCSDAGVVQAWSYDLSPLNWKVPIEHGLLVQGCDLRQVNWASPLSFTEKDLLYRYGAEV